MPEFSKEELNDKSVHEVRCIAKETGVSAPTKCKKGELIDLILKISSGEIPVPTAPKRGRPKKSDSADRIVEQTDNNAPSGRSASKYVLNEEEDEIQSSKEPFNVPKRQSFMRPARENGFNNFKNQETSGGYRRYDNAAGSQRPAENEQRYGDNGYGNRNQPEGGYQRREYNRPQVSALSEDRNYDTEQVREGFLEISPDGYGFLRVKNGEFNDMDAYVNAVKIKQYDLRRGDFVKATCKMIQDGKPAAVVNVLQINGEEAPLAVKRPSFDDLVPIYPDERIRLEIPNRPRDYAIRCIDLVSPIGKGQRGIIVSPPKAGKTTLLKMIAGSIAQNYPDIKLLVLLIDERPEEVTDMQRSINGEVIYSTFDELPEHHTKTAEMLLDRAKRMVESGKDVVILMDSLTRLARAYNLTIPPTGRTLSGGIDPGALHSPKRFFGSARNIEKGGSLTIIATALIDTGSRMDDVIFEEFKGTGNMEIHLDRKLSEKRVFPAIDLAKSGTRKEELLLTPSELEGTWGVRKMLSTGDSSEATENLLSMLVKTASNREFVDQLNLQFKMWQKEGYTFRKP